MNAPEVKARERERERDKQLKRRAIGKSHTKMAYLVTHLLHFCLPNPTEWGKKGKRQNWGRNQITWMSGNLVKELSKRERMRMREGKVSESGKVDKSSCHGCIWRGWMGRELSVCETLVSRGGWWVVSPVLRVRQLDSESLVTVSRSSREPSSGLAVSVFTECPLRRKVLCSLLHVVK